jgi:hypothetical protein
MRTMYDALGENAHAIPADAQLVAGYPVALDPGVAWTQADFDRFPKAAHVRVAEVSNDYTQCSVVDREMNALSPAQAARFVKDRNAYRHDTATVYVDLSNLQQQIRAAAGLTYDLWLAWYIFHPPTAADIARVRATLPETVSLVAWQHTPMGLYDVSAVLDDDWHPEPK